MLKGSTFTIDRQIPLSHSKIKKMICSAGGRPCRFESSRFPDFFIAWNDSHAKKVHGSTYFLRFEEFIDLFVSQGVSIDPLLKKESQKLSKIDVCNLLFEYVEKHGVNPSFLGRRKEVELWLLAKKYQLL